MYFYLQNHLNKEASGMDVVDDKMDCRSGMRVKEKLRIGSERAWKINK